MPTLRSEDLFAGRFVQVYCMSLDFCPTVIIDRGFCLGLCHPAGLYVEDYVRVLSISREDYNVVRLLNRCLLHRTASYASKQALFATQC